MSEVRASITCPRCGRTSHNPNDVAQQYCGACHQFQGDFRPPADDPRAPKYWMYETSGVLREAIWAYLDGGAMTDVQIAAVREYLRQWIQSPAWSGPAIDKLRKDVETIQSRKDIHRWLTLAAFQNEIDPL